LIVPGGNDLVLRNPPSAIRLVPTQRIDKRIATHHQPHPQQATEQLRSYIRIIIIIESHSKQKEAANFQVLVIVTKEK